MYLHELRQNVNTVPVSPIEKTLSNTNKKNETLDTRTIG